MKKGLKNFALGFGIATLLVGTMSLAGNYSETVQRTYRDIKIKLNGSIITPKDANGKTVEPFLIEGTTYLPVRAVSNALGMDVDWDGSTSTVILEGGGSSEYVELKQDIPACMSGLYITDVLVNGDGTYTLQGELFAPYTLSWKELNTAKSNGGMTINGDFYTLSVVSDDEDYKNNYPFVYRLSREDSNYSYEIGEIETMGFLMKLRAQFPFAYRPTGMKAQITVEKDMMFDTFNMFAGDCRMSVEEYFKDYQAEPIQDVMLADTVLCKFSFENGKCVIDSIDHQAHI